MTKKETAAAYLTIKGCAQFAAELLGSGNRLSQSHAFYQGTTNDGAIGAPIAHLNCLFHP
jgi:hypothetical protein